MNYYYACKFEKLLRVYALFFYCTEVKGAFISYDFDQNNFMFWKLVNSFKMMK